MACDCVFAPLAPVQQQVVRTLAFAAISLTAAVLGVLLILQRRAHVLQRIRIEKDQRTHLEVRVRERTSDLNKANASLRTEVVERRNAEEQLRKSQKDLVQAGKLAALGKMSAAISHEVNQPLAAIKSYADNASKLMDLSRLDDVRTNITHISTMSDRITEISQHLRNFARQPGDALKVVNVAEVVRETIGLVGPQLRAQGAEVRFSPEGETLLALGGQLRLQQVLVNIITNALEAMQDQSKPRIDIDLQATGNRVEIIMRDYGPGIASEALGHVFEAFHTTKTAGIGMGLGMSISQNIINDFGGDLSADNHRDGGAVFRVSLQRHSAPVTESVSP